MNNFIIRLIQMFLDTFSQIKVNGFEFFDRLITYTNHLIYGYGYYGFFLFGLLNFVIPSEPVLIFAGTQVAQGKLNFPLVIIFALAGSVIKTTVIYSIGYIFGKEFLVKYSKYTHFKEEYLDFVKVRVDKYGYKMVTIVQFIPIVRRYVSAPFGLLRLNFFKFMFFNMIGVLLWFIFLTSLGVIVGKAWVEIKDQISPFFNWLGIIIILYISWIIIKEFRLSRKDINS
jgi:membrane protein DedA with SNARE-associated domain